MKPILLVVISVISVLLTIQAAHTLYLMIYTWDRPEAGRFARVPATDVAPKVSFTAIVPARHEEDVIQTTIDRATRVDYPAELLQVLVVCSADDTGTIQRARDKIDRLRADGQTTAELVIFDDGPVNKPHGLNAALTRARHDVVAVFDAEDDIQPGIFRIVNTVMTTERVKVVQAGVQLMNYESNWYSTFNVLEYFFWFRSRLHYHAKHGAIPLGGNTVFFARELLERMGGWDESNLTEDADIGLRVCGLGERVRVVYDHRYVTKEETPPTLGHFIRQRTRWSQGFMQTLNKGTWKQLPTRGQRLLAWQTLAFPHVQALLALYLPVALITAFVLHAPVPLTLLAWLPVVLLAAHFLTAVAGLYEFTGEHGLKASPRTVLVMVLTWIPYQLVLVYSAARALRRHLAGVRNWEKTAHVGALRNAEENAPVETTANAHRETGSGAV